MELIGFPTDASVGLLVSGGSTASLTALAAACHRMVTRLGGDIRAWAGKKTIDESLLIYLIKDTVVLRKPWTAGLGLAVNSPALHR